MGRAAVDVIERLRKADPVRVGRTAAIGGIVAVGLALAFDVVAEDRSYPSYQGVIVTCEEIDREVDIVNGYDPHGLDRDGDGVGCEER